MPSAWVISTMSGGCQSVMNPGWVSVCTADGRSDVALALIHSSLISSVGAHLLQRVDGGDHAVLVAAADPHLAAGHQPGHEVAERLEAVALQAWRSAPLSDSTPSITKRRSGRSAMLGAHALEEQRQLDDLGLGGRVVEHGAALGEHGGEQHGLGGADATGTAA